MEHERSWRLRPVTRIAAGLLGSGIILIAVGALVLGGRELLHRFSWRLLGTIVVLGLVAATLGRLFLSAAWTGEEPPIDFD